jgi:hypothetical protein
MADNSSHEVADSFEKTRSSSQLSDASYAAVFVQVMLESWQLWLGLDFQVKLLILLFLWLGVNLLLIRVAWHVYGNRLSEILMKGKCFCSNDVAELSYDVKCCNYNCCKI